MESIVPPHAAPNGQFLRRVDLPDALHVSVLLIASAKAPGVAAGASSVALSQLRPSNREHPMNRFLIASTGIVASVALFVGSAAAQSTKLLNVSYDPTREVYEELNEGFRARYKSETGEDVTIEQSHGGSSKQS